MLFRSRLVKTKAIELSTLVDNLTKKPARVLNLPGGEIKIGAKADLTIIDLNASTTYTKENILSKSKNTPWLDQTIASKVMYTLKSGIITYKDK